MSEIPKDYGDRPKPRHVWTRQEWEARRVVPHLKPDKKRAATVKPSWESVTLDGDLQARHAELTSEMAKEDQAAWLDGGNQQATRSDAEEEQAEKDATVYVADRVTLMDGAVPVAVVDTIEPDDPESRVGQFAGRKDSLSNRRLVATRPRRRPSQIPAMVEGWLGYELPPLPANLPINDAANNRETSRYIRWLEEHANPDWERPDTTSQ